MIDERDKSFFNALSEHYDVVFLDDVIDVMGKQVNTNYYGMVDQLVASRGRIFFGCWFSTFTGYINRLRGYHADNHEEPGYKQGIIKSWYYAMPDRYNHMQEFYPVKQAFYAREFPAAWRLIDTDVEDSKTAQRR
jgi:GDP-fucose protein O-fucosyltransferase